MSRIALSGVAGSGKSTLATHLCDNHSYKELYFADPLKRLVIDIFQIDTRYVYDPEWKEREIPELGVSARQLLQTIGTELFRVSLKEHLPNLKLEGGSVWIHSLVKRLQRLDPDQNVVVSDCRFDDEYEALKKQNFTVYRINRPDIVKVSNHKSEQGCPSDVTIQNDGTKNDLYRQLKN